MIKIIFYKDNNNIKINYNNSYYMTLLPPHSNKLSFILINYRTIYMKYYYFIEQFSTNYKFLYLISNLFVVYINKWYINESYGKLSDILNV